MMTSNDQTNNQKERLALILECVLIFFEKPKEIQELIQGEEEIQKAIALLKQAQAKLTKNQNHETY